MNWLQFGIKRYHAPETGSGNGEGDSFADLPDLGTDGGPETGSDLDRTLDQHIEDTAGGRGPRKTETDDTPATGTGAKGAKGTPGVRKGQAADDDGQDTTRTAQRGTVPQQPRAIGGLFKSGPDNAIYDANGTKVANAGVERRIFERTYRYFQGMEQETGVLKQRIEAMEGANVAARDAGLTLEENAMGLRLMVAWKKDPLQTLNFMLTQAQQQGKDVSSIRAGGGLDAAALREAVKAEISAAFEPFQFVVRNAQQERENTELQSQVAQEITTFFEEHPGAEQHRNVLGAIMEQTGYTPRESWFALRAEAASKGWDLSKPLQQQARRTVSGNGAGPTGGGNSRLPAMNGRGGAGGRQNGTVRAGSLEVASHDASWDDIIRDTVDSLPSN